MNHDIKQITLSAKFKPKLPNWKSVAAAAAAKSLQSCPTLCDPIDGSPPGSPVPGILQARTLEWVTISFSNALKRKNKVKSLSHVRLLATSWTAAYQAPPSMGFSRQEYWSGVPLPSPKWPYINLWSFVDTKGFCLILHVLSVLDNFLAVCFLVGWLFYNPLKKTIEKPLLAS